MHATPSLHTSRRFWTSASTASSSSEKGSVALPLFSALSGASYFSYLRGQPRFFYRSSGSKSKRSTLCLTHFFRMVSVLFTKS